jgi:hypothetical protein
MAKDARPFGDAQGRLWGIGGSVRKNKSRFLTGLAPGSE